MRASFRDEIGLNHFALAGGGFLCRGRQVSFLEAGNVSANHAPVFSHASISGGYNEARSEAALVAGISVAVGIRGVMARSGRGFAPPCTRQ